MKYYMVQPDDYGEVLTCIGSESSACFDQLNDGDVGAWSAPRMRWCRRIRGKAMKTVDFPFVPYGCVVAGKQRAINALKGVTEGCRRWLPLSASGREPVFVAQLTRVAALDEKKSHMDFLGAGTIFPEDEVYALKASAVRGFDILRLSNPFNWVFVSDRFAKRYAEERLTGLDFLDKVRLV